MLSTAISLLIANNGKVLNMITSHMLALPLPSQHFLQRCDFRRLERLLCSETQSFVLNDQFRNLCILKRECQVSNTCLNLFFSTIFGAKEFSLAEELASVLKQLLVIKPELT